MAASKISPASTARLVGLLIVGVLGLAALGLFGTQLAHEEGARALDASLASSTLLDAAREAQVTFKIQVQHWKNLLLRGHDPKDREEYLARFDDDEKAVDRTLDRLAQSAALDASLRPEIAAIRSAHAELGRAYRAAFAQFRPDDPASTFAVDASVRGIDQKLTQRIDSVASRILDAERAHAAALKTAFDARYRTLRLTVGTATLAVLALLIFVVWRSRAAR